MSDSEAFETFKQIRWVSTGGNPVCPRCSCGAIYSYKARRIFMGLLQEWDFDVVL